MIIAPLFCGLKVGMLKELFSQVVTIQKIAHFYWEFHQNVVV